MIISSKIFLIICIILYFLLEFDNLTSRLVAFSKINKNLSIICLPICVSSSAFFVSILNFIVDAFL